ncbi:MAG: GH39 family glycosyl hydrolase [Acidimicrobiales bacterium]
MVGLPRLRWARNLGVLAVLTTLVSFTSTSGATSASLAAVPAAEGTVTVSVDAGHRGAAVNESLLGVDGPGPGGATADMAALGLAWVRTDVSFQDSANYDCNNFTWTGSELDQKLLQIWAEGARPLLIVDYTPQCLIPEQSHGFPPSANYEPPDVGTQPDGVKDKSIWRSAVAQMTTQVLTFAAQHGEFGPQTALAFEIWNEPDGVFWYGGLPGYLNLYSDSAPAIESAAAAVSSTLGTDVQVEVGGPALFFPDASWIEPFLAYVVANHLPLDFVSWHYYGDYPGTGPVFSLPSPVGSLPPDAPVPYWYDPVLRAQFYGQQVQAVRVELAKYPTLHPALWIDEWNVNAGYDSRQDGPYDGAFAAAVLDSVQSAGLDRMAFFDVANTSPDNLGNWGMLFDDPNASPQYTPKPVYWAFAFWHALDGAQLPVALSPTQVATDTIGRIGAVASSGSGSVRVLLYNFVPYDPTGADGTSDPTPYDHQVTISFSGLSERSVYDDCIQIVDGANSDPNKCSPVPLGPSDSVTMTVPGDAIALMTVTQQK